MGSHISFFQHLNWKKFLIPTFLLTVAFNDFNNITLFYV